MTSELPPEIEVIPTTRGTRYVLPCRDLGMLRYVGWGLFLLGLVLIIGPIGAAVPTVVDWIQQGKVDVSQLFSAAFALPALFFGVAAFSWGRKLLFGRNEIYIEDDEIVALGKPGRVGKKRRLYVDEVRHLAVDSGKDLPLPTSFKSLAALTAVTAGERPMLLAWGYNEDLLAALAYRLADEIDHLVEGGDAVEVMFDTMSVKARQRIEKLTGQDGKIVVPEFVTDDGAAAVVAPEPIPPQPRKSTALLTDTRESLTIELPPRGVWRGSKGLIIMAVFWNGFMVIFTPPWFTSGGINGWGMAPLALFLLLFWAIGLLLLFIAINAGRRRAIIDVVGGSLLITRKSLLGLKQQDWPVSDLEAVRVGPSGTEVNGKAVMNLHVTERNGQTTKMFSERDDEELEWIAALVRARLRRDLGR